MTRMRCRALLPGLLTLPLLAVSAGGWATITVEDLPDYVVARQPVSLTFTVRQHGQERMSGLRAWVEAEGGGLRAVTQAAAGREAGRYAATLTLPQPGEWTVTIHSGFRQSSIRLLPMIAVVGDQATVPRLADAERGRRLFVAKGCVTCHVHADATGEGAASLPVGPELTGRRFAAEYLERFLANPAILASGRRSTAVMPNLGLARQEIAALTVFLNGERQALK